MLIGANFWTDLLWYQSVGYTRVFTTELLAKVLLFVVGGLLAGGAVFSSLIIAFRTRPVYAPVSPEQASLDRYREQIEPLRKIGTIVIPIVVGLLSGGAAAGQWKTYLLWRHGQPFDIKDPQFHLDVGFFVFTLPWLRFVAGFLMTVVIVAGIAAAATHYLYGGLRVQGGAGRTTTAARVHLSVILGVARAAARAATTGSSATSSPPRTPTLITGTDVHRRARGAAGQGDPGGGLGHLRGPVLRDDLDRVLAAARRRRRAAAGVRHRDRRDLPGAGAEPPGPPERADPGAAVHLAQHRGHPRGVRPDRRPEHGLQRADDRDVRASCATTPRRSRASGCSTRAGSRTPSGSWSRSGSTTTSRTPWTSTATRSTASRPTP